MLITSNGKPFSYRRAFRRDFGFDGIQQTNLLGASQGCWLALGFTVEC